MKNLQVKYKLIKEAAINLASLGIPMSFLSGWLFGSGHYLAGIFVGIGYILLDNVASRLWLWVLENIVRKETNENNNM